MTQQSIRLATGMNSGAVADVLKTISIEGTAVSVWHRSPPTGLQAWIDRLKPEHLPVLRAAIQRSNFLPLLDGLAKSIRLVSLLA